MRCCLICWCLILLVCFIGAWGDCVCYLGFGLLNWFDSFISCLFVCSCFVLFCWLFVVLHAVCVVWSVLFLFWLFYGFWGCFVCVWIVACWLFCALLTCFALILCGLDFDCSCCFQCCLRFVGLFSLLCWFCFWFILGLGFGDFDLFGCLGYWIALVLSISCDFLFWGCLWVLYLRYMRWVFSVFVDSFVIFVCDLIGGLLWSGLRLLLFGCFIYVVFWFGFGWLRLVWFCVFVCLWVYFGWLFVVIFLMFGFGLLDMCFWVSFLLEISFVVVFTGVITYLVGFICVNVCWCLCLFVVWFDVGNLLV